MKLTRVLLALFVLSLNVTAPTAAGERNPTGSLSAPESPQATATVLFDIEVERAAAATRVHLKADGAIADYREVRLKKNVAAGRPDRIYLDLKNLRLAGLIPVKKAGTSLARVRTGRRPDGIRVVFDSNLDELFDYTISEQPDGLLVTILEPSAEPAIIAALPPADESGAEPEKVVAPSVVTIQPEPKAPGDLDLLIVAADSPEQTQEWLDSPADRKIGLQILQTAQPDQEINTSFLVSGVSSDRNGDYAVEVSFTLLDPSGRVVTSKRRFAKTSGRAPANPAFIRADPVLSIMLGESDPTGEYRLIGIVEDLISNKMVRTSIRITLAR